MRRLVRSGVWGEEGRATAASLAGSRRRITVEEARAPYPDVREGYVVFGTVPYQIPYGLLTPRGAKNLLVPGALSASHVGFGALRLEPIWMALGQAAGVAAELLLTDGAVSVGKLQAELRRWGR